MTKYPQQTFSNLSPQSLPAAIVKLVKKNKQPTKAGLRIAGYFLLFVLALCAEAKQKLLILSGSYGGGHTAAAQATAKEIELQNPGEFDFVIKDVVEFLPKSIQDGTHWGFEWVTRFHPGLFDFGFNRYMSNAAGAKNATEFPSAKALPLAAYLADQKPALVMSTFPSATEILAYLKITHQIPENTKLAWQHTDFSPHPGFIEMGRYMDVIFSPGSGISQAFLKGGVSHVVSTGIPLRDEIKHVSSMTPDDRASFLKSKGLDPHAKTVLIFSGSNGVADYVKLVKKLIQFKLPVGQQLQIVAITSKNVGERQRLEAFLAKTRLPDGVRVHIEMGNQVGLIPALDVARFFKSSDLLIGKAGGVITSEAIEIGIPFIMLDNNGGQERDNIAHGEEHHFGVGLKKQGDILKVAAPILSDEMYAEFFKRMQKQYAMESFHPDDRRDWLVRELRSPTAPTVSDWEANTVDNPAIVHLQHRCWRLLERLGL